MTPVWVASFFWLKNLAGKPQWARKQGRRGDERAGEGVLPKSRLISELHLRSLGLWANPKELSYVLKNQTDVNTTTYRHRTYDLNQGDCSQKQKTNQHFLGDLNVIHHLNNIKFKNLRIHF